MAVLLVGQHGGVLADHFVGSEAGHFDKRAIDIENIGGGVGQARWSTDPQPWRTPKAVDYRRSDRFRSHRFWWRKSGRLSSDRFVWSWAYSAQYFGEKCLATPCKTMTNAASRETAGRTVGFHRTFTG